MKILSFQCNFKIETLGTTGKTCLYNSVTHIFRRIKNSSIIHVFHFGRHASYCLTYIRLFDMFYID